MSLTTLPNTNLKEYVTMRLGGDARLVAEASTEADIREAVAYAVSKGMPLFILGGGSNTLVHDEGYPGLVLLNRIPGFQVITDAPDSVTIEIGAGEQWDDVVQRTVDMGLSGIECLSAIPGTAGAAPVQNIGAYGQEIANTLLSLKAYDRTADAYVSLSNEECLFGYRNSIFRDTAMGRYVIISITLRLSKALPSPPFYKALQDYLDTHAVTVYTPQTIRDAVVAIRKDKLPNPDERPNVGSFFKNAIIPNPQLQSLREKYPEIPAYTMENEKSKVPTGWLIEQTGLKGTLHHGIRVHDKNSLVLINESAVSYGDLAAARDEIITAVRDKFQITIEQEPLEMS